MDNTELLQKALESPALKDQCTEKGTFEYPPKWKGKVPLKVRLLKTVTTDMPMIFPEKEGTLCVRGNEYYVWVNRHGAISAILPNGERLGLKPSEFEVTEFHKTETNG